MNLPASIECEKVLLGSILLDDSLFADAAAVLAEEDFSYSSNRYIFRFMKALAGRGEKIDRITVGDEAKRNGEFDAIGGFSYLVSLDDGLPQLPSLDSYIRIVQEKSTLRKAVFAARDIMNRCLVNHGEDSEIILAEAELLLGKLAERKRNWTDWKSPEQVMESHPGGINEFLMPRPGATGLTTPFPRLNRYLSGGGFNLGDLTLLAGRPSSGKSVLMMQLAHHAAIRGFGSAVFSLEMTNGNLIKRLLAMVSGIDYQRLQLGELDKPERELLLKSASQIRELPIWIDDTRAKTVPAIISAFRRLKQKHPISLLMIDHLQLMRGHIKSQDKNHEISEIVHCLKHLARDHNVVVVLLSQLNRECEKRRDPRPILSDLKESGTIEEDADLVIFTYRPEQLKPMDESLRGKAELVLAKQRNGPTAIVPLLFEKKYQRFTEEVEYASATGDY